MPVKPDSRFAGLSIREVSGPDGEPRRAVSLDVNRPRVKDVAARHVVKHGETIDLIARKYYGDERLWWRILDANPLIYPLDLQPGDDLLIPAAGPVTRAVRARGF